MYFTPVFVNFSHIKATRLWAAHIYSSLIVSITVLDKIRFTGFTTEVAEANATTSKIMSNSFTGTVHGSPKYAEI